MRALLAVAVILALSSSAFGFEYGYCQFQGTSANPSLYGYAYFATSATPDAIDIFVNVGGITQNVGVQHGIHIHQFGDLSDTTAAAATVGTHYSPTGTAHGCPDGGSQNWHDGDTGNWDVNSDGTIVGNKTLTLPKLSGVNSIIGRAVVIHNKTDDCSTTSSSATRLGFCVIGIANPAYYPGGGQSANNASNDSPDNSIPIALCDLQPIGGSGVTGRVWITPLGTSGVKVDAVVNGLTGTRGFHIHQYGDLRLNDTGNSTGGHYNPLNANHGIPPFADRHLGDMGNLYVAINSSSLAYTYNFTVSGNAPVISLTGLNNVIGRAIIVHSAPDNCSQPTGASGSRLAYCVIGIGNSTTSSLISSYGAVSDTQNDTNCVLASPTPSATPSRTPSPAAGASASASPVPGTSASSSPAASSGASASASPGVPSASSTPGGNDSLATSVVPCFVAIASLIVAMVF